MVIAKQRANTNKDIARLAAEIVSKWKKTIEAEKIRKARRAASSPPGANGVASPPEPMAEGKSWVGDKTKRRWEGDKTDIKRTGFPSRDACIGLMYNGLAYMSEESSSILILKAVEVEQAAHSEFKGETPEYKAKLRSLYQN